MRRDPALRSTRHRRPGTAVLAKGQRRSEEILDAATQLLIEDGYAQLSTRKVAARAGMRPGNLQYYYRTKQDVVRALLERYLARSMSAIEARVAASAPTAEGSLRASLDGILADQTTGACQFFWELWALAARDPAVGRAVRGFYQRYRQGVADALRAVNPRLRPAVARRRATLVVGLLEGLTVLRLGSAENPAADAALVGDLRGVVRHLTRGDL